MFRLPLLRSVAVTLLSAALLTTAGCATWVRGSELAREYYNIGNAYYDLERFERAADYYLRALALDSRLTPAGYNLARAYVRDGRYPEARRRLQELLADDPDNLLLRETLAYVDYLSGDIERATTGYQEILALSPLNANALFNLGRIAEEQQRLQQALGYYERAVAVEETDAQLLYRYGRLLLPEQPERAVAVFERYLDSSPRDYQRVVEVADILRRERYFAPALRAYQSVPADHSERPRALFGEAAALLVGVQDSQRGLETMERALEAGFSDREAILAVLQDQDLVAPAALYALLERYQLLPADLEPDAAEASVDDQP